uniref:nicotinamide/nicotinic acid mononucleotide adenylyltransferase 1 n=1 Tax=Myxine glutinosa TaxID=7769 RepID=UPI00358F03D0
MQATALGRQPVILLMCGSFNPITNMHLRLFEIARDYLQDDGRYQVVKGILSPVSDRYKKKGLIPVSHRVAMARLATKGSDWIHVDAWESEQDAWLETIKVMRHHSQMCTMNRAHEEELEEESSCCGKRKAPSHKGSLKRLRCDERDNDCPNFRDSNDLSKDQTKVMLLCGADVLQSFCVKDLWKKEDIEEIVGRFGILCISRHGSSVPRQLIQDVDILWKCRCNIHIVDNWILNATNSTDVRREARRGHSVKFLVPDAVAKYIEANGVYTDKSEQINSEACLAPFSIHRRPETL